MMFIDLNNGKRTIVDKDTYIQLSSKKWRIHTKGYVSAVGKGELMHRLIMNAKKSQQVDHINGNKLDNRKSNLRLCSNSQNHMNKSKCTKEKSSKYKGVYWCKRKKRWRVCIKLNKKKIHIGDYKDEDAAGIAYNNAAIEIFKEFACLNKIDGDRV
jgi:hypothetical protein